jgi:regulatory protein YycI of two-component signal transduction system YycFG
MNLGRAKLILIIAFAGLNLFLAYHLFWPDFGRLTRMAATAEELRATEAILNEKNYYLETSLDRTVRTGSFLTVSRSLEFQRQVLLRMLQEGAEFSHSDEGTYYQKDEKTAFIRSNGLIKVIYTPPHELAGISDSLDDREVRALVEKFLLEENLMPTGAVFDYVENISPGARVLHYYQLIDEVAIFTGQLKVIIEGNRIRSVEIYWVHPVEDNPGREMEVLSAIEALSNLVRDLGPSDEPQLITSITLGYFSGEIDAEKWEISPVWRIVMQNEQVYYINAFTGNLEQDSMIPDQLSKIE